MAGKEVPLTLIMKAFDRVSGPVKAAADNIKALQDPVKRVNEQLEGIGKATGVMALGGAIRTVAGEVQALGERLYGLIKSSLDSGSALMKNAKAIGFSVDLYAQMQYAAQRGGASADEYTSSMKTLSKGIGMATLEQGRLFKLASEASPAFGQQIKKAKSVEEGFDLIARAMAKLPDPMRRTALATAAFGGSGAKMLGLFEKGPAGIVQMRQEFMRLAGPQEEFAKTSKEINGLLFEANTAYEGVKRQLVVALAPAFRKLLPVVTEFFVKNRPAIAAWAKDFGEKLPDRIKAFVEKAKEIKEKVGAIMDKIGGWRTVMLAFGAIIAGPLVKAVVSLGAALLGSPVGLVITGIALGALLIRRHWEPIKAFFTNLWGRVTAIFGAAWSWVKEQLGFDPLAALRATWEPAKTWFVDHWGDIKAGFSTAWEWIKAAFEWTPLAVVVANWGILKPYFKFLWDSITGIFSFWWEVTKGIFEWTPLGQIIANWEPVKKYLKDLWDEVVAVFNKGYAAIRPIVEKVGAAASLIKAGVAKFAPDTREPVNMGTAPLADVDQARPFTDADMAKLVTQQKGRIKVEFTNLPRGAKVKDESEDDDMMEVLRGYAMDGEAP